MNHQITSHNQRQYGEFVTQQSKKTDSFCLTASFFVLGLVTISDAAGPDRLHVTDPLEAPPHMSLSHFLVNFPPHSIGPLFGLPIFLTRSETKYGGKLGTLRSTGIQQIDNF